MYWAKRSITNKVKINFGQSGMANQLNIPMWLLVTHTLTATVTVPSMILTIKEVLKKARLTPV